MKKSIFIFIIAFVFTACSSPTSQVTSIPEATVTSSPPTDTPVPAPTLHPQFLAIQDQIAAAGERFTLNSNGTVQDGADTIPGLHVAPDGKATITVDGEQVEIDPASMHMDDVNGLTIDGYENADGDDDFEPVDTGLTPEIQAIVDGWKGHLTINEDGQFLNINGGEIEGMVYNRESKMVEMTRSDAVGHDFTEQFDPKLIVVETDDAGEVVDETINYVFSLDENGQLERLKYGETSEYLYTQNEVVKMIAENHSTAPGADLDTLAHMEEIFDSNFLVKPPSGIDWYIKFGDFYEPKGSPGGTFFGTNKVRIWNSETNMYEVINTSEYAARGFGGKKDGDPSYAVVAWMDANGVATIKIVHGKQGINHHSAWWGITE